MVLWQLGIRYRIPSLMRAASMKKKKAHKLITKWNIVRGDKVEVISGKEKGKQGIVLAVLRKRNRVIVDNVNIKKRIQKSLKTNQKFMVPLPSSLDYSSVMLVDPVTEEPTRISRRYIENGSLVRISKKTGVIIPKPEASDLPRKPRNLAIGPKDTQPNIVSKITYNKNIEIDDFINNIFPSYNEKIKQQPKKRWRKTKSNKYKVRK